MILNQQQHLALQASTNIQKFDLTITNTIASDTKIELFNNLFSNTKVYNPACNPTYYPISVRQTPFTTTAANTTNGYTYVYLMGGADDFVDADAVGSRVPTTTRAFILFDEAGALVYKPGYVGGTLDAGKLTVQSKQTNYRHVFETLGQSAIYIRNFKVTITSQYSSAQLAEDFKFVSQNITSSAGTNAQGASTYSSEFQYNANIVTMPINQGLDPNSGVWYNVKASDGTTPNVIQLSVYFVPMTANML